MAEEREGWQRASVQNRGFLLFLLFEILLTWKSYIEKEREGRGVHWLVYLQMAAGQEPGASSELPCGWQGPKQVGHL